MFGYDPELPAGFQDADFEMRDLEEVGNRAARREAALRGWRRPSRAQDRACSDCEAYAPLATMLEKPDGRVICQACERKIQAAARDKAQGSLFVTQPALF